MTGHLYRRCAGLGYHVFAVGGLAVLLAVLAALLLLLGAFSMSLLRSAI